MQEGINGEFEEKKADLQPKVVEIYESVPAPLKVQTFKLLSLEHNLNVQDKSTNDFFYRVQMDCLKDGISRSYVSCICNVIYSFNLHMYSYTIW